MRSFTRFNEEFESTSDRTNPENIKILVDQMMEPYDIIWTNVGGNRGIYIFRQIFIYIMAILMLIFLTTPTVNFNFYYFYYFCYIYFFTE